MASRKKRFLEEFIPLARQICVAYEMPWQVCVVQAYAESGWGYRNISSPKHNNRWGIKAGRVYAPATVKKFTKEFDENGKFRIRGTFSSWPTLTEGVEGWIAFLSRKRYKRPLTWGFEDDPARFITWIWGRGYATAPHYVERYIKVARKLAEKIGDESLLADIDPPLASCIADIRGATPGKARYRLASSYGLYGFSGECETAFVEA